MNQEQTQSIKMFLRESNRSVETVSENIDSLTLSGESQMSDCTLPVLSRLKKEKSELPRNGCLAVIGYRLPSMLVTFKAVSYTHLTLPTRRTV